MGFSRVAKRRTGGMGRAWGPSASRPTPRTTLPVDGTRFAAPVRFEAAVAAKLRAAFDDLTGLLLTADRLEAMAEGDWVSLLDAVDWTAWERRVLEDIRPEVWATIEREGHRALAEIRLGLQRETSLAVRVTGAIPEGEGVDYSQPRPLRTGSAPPVVPPIDGGGLPVAPSPRSGGFYATARFDMTNPFAVAHAERFAADLVRQVSANTRAAIKQTVVESFREGFTVDQVARSLRETVGLTSGQARAVSNFRARLERAGKLSDEQVERAVRRYYRKTLKRRSETIARTEIMRASNHGRMSAFFGASDVGLLDANASVKEWVTAPENSSYGPPCASCLPMDGVKVLGLETPFSLPTGRRLVTPPAHPNCRCTFVVWPPEPPEDWDPEYPHAQV